MTTTSPIESHHGVLMNILGHGVFITGKPAIGKSSLALALLDEGHQLIADDIAEFRLDNDQQIIGACPSMLAGLLHTRELGLIMVKDLFGQQAWQATTTLNYIVQLQYSAKRQSTLQPQLEQQTICTKRLPKVVMSTHNPASLSLRIITWLKLQTTVKSAENILAQRQKKYMVTQ